MRVKELCVTKLRVFERFVCVTKLCVKELCVIKMCVKELCVRKLGVTKLCVCEKAVCVSNVVSGLAARFAIVPNFSKSFRAPAMFGKFTIVARNLGRPLCF